VLVDCSHLPLVAGRYAPQADYAVDDHVLEAAQRLLEAA
jgi:hypothetical protein